MMHILLCVVLFGAASEVLPSSISLPCKLSDQSCLDNMANDLKRTLFAASPEHSIESSDPLYMEEVVADRSMFKLRLYNNTLIGYLNCVVSNLKISKDKTRAQCDSNCHNFTLSGQYDMGGQILGLPAEGNGDYLITTGKYFVHIELELKSVDLNDGKPHVAIEKFKLKMKPQEAVKFDMKNLFNGQKDLAEALNKLNKEHWREVTEFIQEPIWYTFFNKVAANINKHLEILELEDLVAT